MAAAKSTSTKTTKTAPKKTATTTAKKKAPVKKKRVAPKHPLADMIPAARYSEEYVCRTINGAEDIDVFRVAGRTMHNVLIEGPTGAGKTSAVYAYAHEENLPVVYVPCNGGADPATLFGQWKPDGEGGWAFIEGPITTAARHGGVIYLDEVNMMPMKIAAVLHGALDKRRTIVVLGGDADNIMEATIELHDNCQVIATYNEGYHDTRPLNQAFKNRFAFKLMFQYDREVEDQFISITPLLDMAERLRDGQKRGELRTPCGPNLLLEFELTACELGFDFGVFNFLNAFHEDERSTVEQVINVMRDEIFEATKIIAAEWEYEWAVELIEAEEAAAAEAAATPAPADWEVGEDAVDDEGNIVFDRA